MSNDVVIRVEKLSKRYRLGLIGGKTLQEDLQRWWAKLRGKPDPIPTVDQLEKLKAQNSTLHSPGSMPPSPDGHIWALRDINFEVKQGEILGIIGANGAGKSTLLKILTRITAPTKGRALMEGRVGALLEVGTGFHGELTGRENIFLSGAILGMTKAEVQSKLDEIIDFSGCEQYIDTPIKRYSSGMNVRLGFAVAAHLEPEILLIDEVLAVGDAQFQKKCLGKMGDVAKEGRTILFVSHNMIAMQSLCNRAIWLDKGQIVEAGEVSQVVASYVQSGTLLLIEQVWDDPATAPGNDKVRLHRIRVTPANQEPGEPITLETALQVAFEFWNYLPGAVLNFTMHLFTIDGIYVLAVGSDARPRHKGLVRGTVQIPSRFLNAGIYTVAIMIVKDRSVSLYHHHDAVVFEIHDSGRTGNWFGKWPGVVRPQLKWLTEDVRGAYLQP